MTPQRFTPGQSLIYQFIDWRSPQPHSFLDEPVTFVEYRKGVPVVVLRGRENWVYATERLRPTGTEPTFVPKAEANTASTPRPKANDLNLEDLGL